METIDLDQLAFQFFRLFAQYEYALKAMGYGRAGKKDAAEADWDRFANELGKVLLGEKDLAVAEARELLLTKPPKRQVWINSAVEWAEVPNTERTAQIMFSHIRRVRNNLYHGGKFNGRWINPDRSEELIAASLLMLQHLMKCEQQLSEAIQLNAV